MYKGWIWDQIKLHQPCVVRREQEMKMDDDDVDVVDVIADILSQK